MTTSRSRIQRGRDTEFIVAEGLKLWYPDAYATNKSAPGDDIGNTGRLAIEVKATSKDSLLAALRQAHARAQPDQIPIVISRPNGYGEARLSEWIVSARFGTFFTAIAPRAGYFKE